MYAAKLFPDLGIATYDKTLNIIQIIDTHSHDFQ
jgi:hypothetical protein